MASLPKGITQRGASFRWSCMVEGVRRTGSASTLEQAVADRAAAAAEMKYGYTTKGATVTPLKADNSWTLQKAVDTAFNLPAPEGWLGLKHPLQVQKLTKQLLEFFGPNTPLHKITKGDADAWVAKELKRGNSASTINQKLCALSKVLKVAYRNGGLDRLPVLPKRLKTDNARDRELSPEEERQLLSLLRHMGKDEQADAVSCLIDLGCRNSELWAVEARDLDFKNGLVFLYGAGGRGTKNGSFRSVPMSNRVRSIMEARAASTAKPTDRVFPFDNWWLRSAWERVRILMGLDEDPQFVPYICRHTCASRLIRGGAPIPVVQRWLGHKTIQMTMRYAHLMPSDLLKHVSILE